VFADTGDIVSHACNTGSDFWSYESSMAADIAKVTQRTVWAWTGRTSYSYRDAQDKITSIHPSTFSKGNDWAEVWQNIKTWDIDAHYLGFAPLGGKIGLDWSRAAYGHEPLGFGTEDDTYIYFPGERINKKTGKFELGPGPK
jgi:hypothetical protein